MPTRASALLRTIGLMIGASFLGVVAAQEVQAARIEFAVSGIVTRVDDATDLFGGLFSVGMPFVAHLAYRDDLVDVAVADDIGHFHYEEVQERIALTTTLGGVAFETDPLGLAEIDVRDDVLGEDRFWVSISAVLSEGLEIDQMNLVLSDPSRAAFDSSVLPLMLDLSAFGIRTLDLRAGGGASIVEMEIQSLVQVPEPGPALLIAVGLLIVASGRRAVPRIG